MRKFSFYKAAMGLAVQAKRILQGNFNQTRYTRYLESIERLPREQLKEIQASNLSVLLNHAVDKVPIYKKYKGELELSPKTVFSDILEFPVVTKQMLHDNPEEFIAPDEPYIRKLYSGGTTMLKVTVLRDRSSLNFRNDEYFTRMAGIYPGMPKLILSRPENTYYEDNTEWPEFIANDFTRTYLVSVVKYDRSRFEKARSFLLEKKPVVFKGTSVVLYEFAKEMEREGYVSDRETVVYCSQSTMQPEYRDTFERVLGARTHDAYGATETNVVAAQCRENRGLHYSPSTHFIELVDSHGKEVNDGGKGELQITSMFHRAMPIIRYRIGDLATKTGEMCSCGRTFPMLASIDGRTIEVIRTPGGGLMSSGDFRVVLKEYPEVRDFMVTEEEVGKLRLSLVTDAKLSSDRERELASKISEYAKDSFETRIEYIEKLPRLANGKVLRVVPMNH